MKGRLREEPIAYLSVRVDIYGQEDLYTSFYLSVHFSYRGLFAL